jgi:hypothetical protein
MIRGRCWKMLYTLMSWPVAGSTLHENFSDSFHPTFLVPFFFDFCLKSCYLLSSTLDILTSIKRNQK